MRAATPIRPNGSAPVNLTALRVADMLDGGVRVATEMLNGRPDGPLVLDDWQTDALLNHGGDDQLYYVHRQGGKSLVAAAAVLHAAATIPGASIGVLAAGEVAALKILKAVRGGLHAVPYVTSVNNAASRIELSNASVIEAFAGANASGIRGQTFGHRDFPGMLGLLIDEAAFVTEDSFQAAMPTTVINRARHILASTPGPQGTFMDLVGAPTAPGYHRVTRTADMCPRLTPEVLAKEEARMGTRRFRVEYFLVPDLGTAQRVFGDSAQLLGLYDDDPADDDPEPFEDIPSRLARLRSTRP